MRCSKFVRFLKRTRNLAVTDAAFNATVENLKDIVSRGLRLTLIDCYSLCLLGISY